jgi:hypothetical protein
MSAQDKFFSGCKIAEIFAAGHDFASACSALGIPTANRRPVVAVTPCTLHQSLSASAIQNNAVGRHMDRITFAQPFTPYVPEVFSPQPDSILHPRSLQAGSNDVKLVRVPPEIGCAYTTKFGPQGDPWTSFD